MKVLIILVITLTISSCYIEKEQSSIKETKDTILENKENTLEFEDKQKEIKWEITIEEKNIQINWSATWKWFFEASFIIKLYDWENLLSQNIAKTNENWMTSDYVNFSSTIDIENINRNNIILVFENANPSWLEENKITKEIKIKDNN